jgi:hypothetical protein
MISNFIDDLNDGLALLIDDQGNELIANFSKGKATSYPEEISNKNDTEYVKLKNFYTEVLSSLNYTNVEESPNYLV